MSIVTLVITLVTKSHDPSSTVQMSHSNYFILAAANSGDWKFIVVASPPRVIR